MTRFSIAILACLFMFFEVSVQEQEVSNFYQIALPNQANNYNFETTRNMRQVQGIFKTIQVFDDLACIHECGRNPFTCIAVNFKKLPGKALQDCELLEFEGRKDDEMHFENNNDFDFIAIKNPQFQDCSSIQRHRKATMSSNVYHIRPHHFRSFSVSCDFNTNGGGWTVIQRRINASVDFYRGWNDYKRGFGDKNSNYWLGLDNIHVLTSHNNYRLRVDLEDFEGNKRFAEYDMFYVAGEDDQYRLTIGGYSGNAGNSLSSHNNYQFSTKDRDNDVHGGECAKSYRGAWWYAACHSSNLNGLYLNGPDAQYAQGVVWNSWLGYHYSLKTAVMKIRPRDF